MLKFYFGKCFEWFKKNMKLKKHHLQQKLSLPSFPVRLDNVFSIAGKIMKLHLPQLSSFLLTSPYDVYNHPQTKLKNKTAPKHCNLAPLMTAASVVCSNKPLFSSQDSKAAVPNFWAIWPIRRRYWGNKPAAAERLDGLWLRVAHCLQAKDKKFKKPMKSWFYPSSCTAFTSFHKKISLAKYT